MPDLSYRQQKIQEKRKQTPWRQFVKEMASWISVVFYKVDGLISVYPNNLRINKIVSVDAFDEQRVSMQGQEWGSVSFFKQFGDLLSTSLFPALVQSGACENTVYAEGIVNAHNIYLSHTVIKDCENILYSFSIKDYCRNILNGFHVISNCENVYMSSNITNAHNIFYSHNIQDSDNIWLSVNLIGCHECINCSGLVQQRYCIDNVSYAKEEYFSKRTKRMFAHKDDIYLQNQYMDMKHAQSLVACTAVTGNNLFNCHDAKHVFSSVNLSHARNVIFAGSLEVNEKYYDVFMAGRSTDFYGVVWAGTYSSHCYCSFNLQNCHNIYYSMLLEGCSYCLGCIGLKNKTYCIFNKQYTQDEWHNLVNTIFSQMDKAGIMGSFFPGWVNPCYFNDTAAYLIEDFTKEEIVAEGYLRRDEEVKVDIPEWMEVVPVDKLDEYQGYIVDGDFTPVARLDDESMNSLHSDVKRHIDPAILKKVIRDEKGNVYRVIKMEYDFLMKYGLPLPRMHRLERLKTHFYVQTDVH